MTVRCAPAGAHREACAGGWVRPRVRAGACAGPARGDDRHPGTRATCGDAAQACGAHGQACGDAGADVRGREGARAGVREEKESRVSRAGGGVRTRGGRHEDGRRAA
ncbi:hypothetical protein GCM10010247_13910 [Streptomyces calvus]|nr:hypothetical protein GCM10010247_13910 [Streptomyces calvus]